LIVLTPEDAAKGVLPERLTEPVEDERSKVLVVEVVCPSTLRTVVMALLFLLALSLALKNAKMG